MPTLDERDRAIGAKVRALVNETDETPVLFISKPWMAVEEMVHEDQILYGNPTAPPDPPTVGEPLLKPLWDAIKGIDDGD